jgi:hypothetical protein
MPLLNRKWGEPIVLNFIAGEAACTCIDPSGLRFDLTGDMAVCLRSQTGIDEREALFA